MKKKWLIAAIAALLIGVGWFACKGKIKDTILRDWSITSKTSYNNLFMDSAQLDAFLESDTIYKVYKQQFFDFYKHRNYEYAWFDSSGLGEQARNFKNLLDNAIYTLQDSSLYSKEFEQLFKAFHNDSLTKENEKNILKTELVFTGQFFNYAAKVYKGSDIDVTKLGWFIPRKKIELAAFLDSVIKSKGKNPQNYAPLNSQYYKLEEWVIKYYKIKEKNPSWDSIPKPEKTFKMGDSSRAIAMIKERLYLLGDLSLYDSTGSYDELTENAVKRFQQRFGLKEDGEVDKRIVSELNITLDQRIRQILINLERARWVPTNPDSDYMVVNIPEFRLHVYEKGGQSFDMNVIVGTAANNTVVFSGMLSTVVFAPYWNVPSSIVKNEMLGGISRNENYLANRNMEITGYSGTTPIIRQKPGPGNSLGKVKFLFPNSYNIYLHDTPNHELFKLTNRSFSHGCIRLSDPQKLAEFVLRNQPGWSADSVKSAMKLSKEKWVPVKHPIPVFIVYFTSWVDQSGNLNFRRDLYKHDEKVAKKLFLK